MVVVIVVVVIVVEVEVAMSSTLKVPIAFTKRNIFVKRFISV
jgi:hypothetical protein